MVGPNGEPYVQLPNGTIVGPDGQVLKGVDGMPIIVPEGHAKMSRKSCFFGS